MFCIEPEKRQSTFLGPLELRNLREPKAKLFIMKFNEYYENIQQHSPSKYVAIAPAQCFVSTLKKRQSTFLGPLEWRNLFGQKSKVVNY